MSELAQQVIVEKIRAMTAEVSTHHFQQHPEELGGMIHLLLQQPDQPKSYLEIGAGAGHVARVLDHFFNFSAIRLIDDGKHYSGRLQQVPKAQEWVGDSTSKAAMDAVTGWGLRFDLIFIDAGHTYHEVVSDTRLALGYVADQCWLAFHDARHGEVRQWLAKLDAGCIQGVSHVRLFGRSDDGKKNLSLFRWDKP